MQAINVVPCIPNATGGAVAPFGEADPYFPERNYVISGMTKDATGAVLAFAIVALFSQQGSQLVQEQVSFSNASGVYSFTVDKNKSWRVMASKSGSPNLSGLTDLTSAT